MRLVGTTSALLAVGLIGLFAVSGCNSGPSDKPNVELVQDMMDSPSIKAQEYDEDSEAGRGMRVPPEHTAPIGFERYKYAGDAAAAEANLVNPIKGSDDPSLMMKGQRNYETHCLVCHGPAGLGDGPVASKMALKPPPLVSDKVRNWKDGHIYHIIREGQGLMGPYASHIPSPQNRWAVVNYVRHLQQVNAGK
jgi:mono/diheme cytochrome c family protein